MKNKHRSERMERLNILVNMARIDADLSDEYSVGLANGLILAEAVMKNEIPAYLRVKKEEACGTSSPGSPLPSAQE
jgi:hypothetical protein